MAGPIHCQIEQIAAVVFDREAEHFVDDPESACGVLAGNAALAGACPAGNYCRFAFGLYDFGASAPHCRGAFGLVEYEPATVGHSVQVEVFRDFASLESLEVFGLAVVGSLHLLCGHHWTKSAPVSGPSQPSSSSRSPALKSPSRNALMSSNVDPGKKFRNHSTG